MRFLVKMRPERQRISKLPARFRDEDDPPAKRAKVTKTVKKTQKKCNKMDPGPSSPDPGPSSADPGPSSTDPGPSSAYCPLPTNNEVYFLYLCTVKKLKYKIRKNGKVEINLKNENFDKK